MALPKVLTDVLVEPRLKHRVGTDPRVRALAACIYALAARDFGLTEKDGYQATSLAPETTAFATHYLGSDLRASLYDVFLAISRDAPDTAAITGRSSLVGEDVLRLAQIGWVLKHSDLRPELPYRPYKGFDIAVDGWELEEDCATTGWSERSRRRIRYLGASGKVDVHDRTVERLIARIAVVAACRLAASFPDGPAAPEPRHERQPFESGSNVGAGSQDEDSMGSVVIGNPPAVAASYRQREHDLLVQRAWTDGGDRCVWLRGAPGLGKTYSARRIWEDALAERPSVRERLLIWADARDVDAVVKSYVRALGEAELVLGVPAGDSTSGGRDAVEALFSAMRTSGWKWLVVLDDGDADELVAAGLVPPGGNPNGRVLITTNSTSRQAPGQVVQADLFTLDEARDYIRVQTDPHSGRTAAVAEADEAEIRAICEAVGFHPLALSIAVNTIRANPMSIAEWIAEFDNASMVDAAADEPDPGGYPTLIAGAWRAALNRASKGLPEGEVERAALAIALQDTAGQPTWLWEDRRRPSKRVAGGGKLRYSHGRPTSVKRLCDYGLVDFHGTSWADGRLFIHPLAARVVREDSDAEARSLLASDLILEWLGRQAEPGARTLDAVDTAANLRAILSGGAPAGAARSAASAALFVSRTEQRESPRVRPFVFGAYAAELDRVGCYELSAELAHDLGDYLDTWGLFTERDAYYRFALARFEALWEDPRATTEVTNTTLYYSARASELQVRLGAESTMQWFEEASRHYRAIDVKDRGSLLAQIRYAYTATLAGHLGLARRVASDASAHLRSFGFPSKVGEPVRELPTYSPEFSREVAKLLAAMGMTDQARAIVFTLAVALGRLARHDASLRSAALEWFRDLVEFEIDRGSLPDAYMAVQTSLEYSTGWLRQPEGEDSAGTCWTATHHMLAVGAAIWLRRGEEGNAARMISNFDRLALVEEQLISRGDSTEFAVGLSMMNWRRYYAACVESFAAQALEAGGQVLSDELLAIVARVHRRNSGIDL